MQLKRPFFSQTKAVISSKQFRWGGQRYNGSQLPRSKEWTWAAAARQLLVTIWKARCRKQKVQFRACLVETIPVNDLNGWWRDDMQQFEPLLLWMEGCILELYDLPTRLRVQMNIFFCCGEAHNSAQLMEPQDLSVIVLFWLNAEVKYYLHLKGCRPVSQLSGNQIKVLVVTKSSRHLAPLPLWWSAAINS